MPTDPTSSPDAGPPERFDGLCFDDDPLEPRLDGEGAGPGPSPADAVERWRRGIDRTDATGRAVIAILGGDGERLAGLPDTRSLERCMRQALADLRGCGGARVPREGSLLAAIGMLLALREQADEAEACLREALDALAKGNAQGSEEYKGAAKCFEELLVRTGRGAEAAEWGRRAEMERLLAKDGRAHGIEIRFKAYHLYLDGRYGEAERLLQHLLGSGFDLAGTRCHLARLCLLTNREPEARAHVAECAVDWHGTPFYVQMRVVFFRALFAMLDGGDGREPLCEIARGLHHPLCCSEWTIQPVLDVLAPRLPGGRAELMARVAAALNAPENLMALEIEPGWSEIALAVAAQRYVDEGGACVLADEPVADAGHDGDAGRLSKADLPIARSRFEGRFAVPVDASGRIALPANWRQGMQAKEETYLVFCDPAGCLSVAAESFLEGPEDPAPEASSEPAEDAEDRKLREAAERALATSASAPCDAKGRLSIPAFHRQHAGLVAEAVLDGRGNHFAIWRPDRFKR